MALPSNEAEILQGGVDSRTPANSSFALNMLYRRGAWEVRDGFGQMSQHTTSFALPFSTAASKAWGIVEHMGSTLIETNFGHIQILSAFKARVNTSNTITNASAPTGPNSSFENAIVVHIDDVTDGSHWEEALYQHTSINQNVEGASQLSTDRMSVMMAYWHGNYETGSDRNRQAWIKADVEKPLFFHEFRDAVIFGSEEVGVWIYYPSHFRHAKVGRSVQVDTSAPVHSIGKYSESSRISTMAFTPGIAAGYPYFTTSTLPGFADATSVGSTVVYGGGRQLFFSDPELPASIIAENFVFVPCEGEIVALEEQLGNVLVFTESETFVYRIPSGTAIKSGGQFTQISNSVGCVGPSAVTRAEGRVVWISPNGIYSTSGNFIVEKTGAPVERFFTDYMTNPLTSYYPKSGMMDAANIQPQTTLQADLKNSNIVYCNKLETVVATFPENNASLVYTGGKWAVWTYESVAFSQAGVAEVGVTRNITSPWVVSTSTRMFMVGSPDQQILADAHAPIENILTNSYYLLEYGRGGALDRSVDDEDERDPVGFFEIDVAIAGVSSANTSLVYGKPFRLGTGYSFRGAQPTLTDSDSVWLVPIYAILPSSLANTGVTVWRSHVTFNNLGFSPILVAGGATDIDFLVPSERLGSESGYARGAGAVGHRVRVNAVGGNTIFVEFDQAPAGTVPINLTPSRMTPLLYLPFGRVNLTDNVYMDIAPIALNQTFEDGIISVQPTVLVWQKMFVGTGSQRFENSVVQPVDYAYKSAHVGMEEPQTLMARGLYAIMLSRGPGLAADFAVPDWDAGLFNTLVSSDRKGWMSQIIDYVGSNADAITRLTDQTSIRTRIRTATGIANEVFGAELTYGASNNATAGNYLIADEEVSSIATSDSAKGGCFSYMIFGHIQIRSQKIKLQSVKAAFRATGGRRRFGH